MAANMVALRIILNLVIILYMLCQNIHTLVFVSLEITILTNVFQF